MAKKNATIALALCALMLAFALVVFGCPGGGNPPGNVTANATNGTGGSGAAGTGGAGAGGQAAATHTEAQVQANLTRYLIEYYGWTDEAYWGMKYDAGVWEVDLEASSLTTRGALKAFVHDENLAVKSLYSRSAVLSSPAAEGIQRVEGKVSCAENGTPVVMEFGDPYCEWTLFFEPKVAQVREQFNTGIRFEYHVLQSASLALAKSANASDVNLAAYYFICAQEQGKLDEFKNCSNYNYAQHVGVPNTREALAQCANQSGLDGALTASCLAGAAPKLAIDKSLAETYLKDRQNTPTMLINCQYRSSPRLAEYALCYTAPETKGCENVP